MAGMTEVRADEEGEVHAITGHNPSVVFIRHRDDVIQSYSDLSEVRVALAQQVAKDELIGHRKTHGRS